MKTLIVVDMQNDFLTGSLANPAAQEIIEPMAEYIKNFDGDVIFTQDTHYPNYLNTQEGNNLPIIHCQYAMAGWEIESSLWNAAINEKRDNYESYSVLKDSFGDIKELDKTLASQPDTFYICGTCTDICVISVALNLKARFPETKIICLGDLCAGLTPEKHAAALEVMRSCQIEVI